MIVVKSVYVGNSIEAYVQTGFTTGVNIITSDENHVGKTVVMQSIMYALGAEPLFPGSFPFREYVYIVDLEIDEKPVSILRNRDCFAIRDSDSITPLEGLRSFDDYWSEHISKLPAIVKDGRVTTAGLPLYTQMSFVPQSSRNTARTLTSYLDKKDFLEMVYALVGLDARAIDTEEIKRLKSRKAELETRRKELSKQAEMLEKVGSSLAAISPTSDREETERIVGELDRLRNDITEQRKRRNRALTRKMKNETVLAELRSLNRDIQEGSVVCLSCGSEQIGYKLPGSSFVFDITTADMRTQIIQTIVDRIRSCDEEANNAEREIRTLQRRFNDITDSRDITLEDIFVARDGYRDLEDIDREYSNVCDEIDDIKSRLQVAKAVDGSIKKDRSEFKSHLLDTMYDVRRKINDNPTVERYPDLFTSNTNQYTGSESMEFYIARVYALAQHVRHPLPVIIDSFRAEELSTLREERALPLFKGLPNQVILTATLKQSEVGKYDTDDTIHSISFVGYTENKLLSSEYLDEFLKKLDEFGVHLTA